MKNQGRVIKVMINRNRIRRPCCSIICTDSGFETLFVSKIDFSVFSLKINFLYFPYATPYVQPGYYMHPQFYHSYRPQQAQLSAAAQPFVMKPGQMMQQMPMMNVQNPNIPNSSVSEKKLSTDSKLPMSNKEIYEKRQQKTPTPEKKNSEEK